MNEGFQVFAPIAAAVTRTFYVIFSSAYGCFSSSPGPEVVTGFWSTPSNTVDNVTQYATLADAMKRWAKNTYRQEGYHIVRVDRSTIPGTTTRRLLREGEPVPANAKIAIANPYSRLDNSEGTVVFYGNPLGSVAVRGLKDALLFKDHTEVIRHIANANSEYFREVGGNLVRVVEETSAPTTKDVLTHLK